ncbi:MAG: biotin--[acetyl-CoA-carboxylase] ligase, partial [Actinomycetota bacterium]
GATSVAAEGGDPDAEALLRRYLVALRREYEASDFPAGIVERYVGICSTLGRRIRAEQMGVEPVEGVATGLTDRGGLIVQTEDGQTSLSFGEVTHLRAS